MIQLLKEEEDIRTLMVCGHVLCIQKFDKGYGIPFVTDSNLHMYFDTFNEAIWWYVDNHDLWLKV